MVKKYLGIIGLSLSMCISVQEIQAQFNGLLQANDLIDYYRVLQITDSAAARRLGITHHSFVVRPFMVKGKSEHGKKFSWGMTQVNLSQYYNDSIGGGLNNESFYNAAGWQQRISVGARLRYEGIHIQVQPELVLAQNKPQAMISTNFKDADFFSRYYFYNINTIDLPSRPGTQSISRLFPGQSFIRYELENGLAAGVSTENIWWGPGLRNSLVMTNNAPGFLHMGVQTIRPVKTAIGSFEGQALIGWLDSSGVEPVENARQFAEFWPGAYVPKDKADRSILGMVVSWQPKWVPNLFIGFAASGYFYRQSQDLQGQPFPEYPYSSSSRYRQTSMGSLFFRYAMPEEGAEFYAEFGRADRPAHFFNLIGDTIPLGYTVGFRKLFRLGANAGYIDLATEITQLQLPDPRLIFTLDIPYSIPKTRSWYTHAGVRHGYTHNGQLLGAGIGSGSNSQTLHITWIKGLNRLGITAERIAHNRDFFYYSHLPPVLGFGLHNRYWTDLSIGLHGQYAYRQFLFAGAINSTSALNYRWVKVDGTFDGPSSSDKRNLQVTISVAYRFAEK
jgi:hypothetical protein